MFVQDWTETVVLAGRTSAVAESGHSAACFTGDCFTHKAAAGAGVGRMTASTSGQLTKSTLNSSPRGGRSDMSRGGVVKIDTFARIAEAIAQDRCFTTFSVLGRQRSAGAPG